MNRKLQTFLLRVALVIAAHGACAAEGPSINFDASTDFQALRTFAIGAGHLTTSKPEIDNRLFRQRLENSIRAALVAKGLKEVAAGADLSVNYTFNDMDYSVLQQREPVGLQGPAGNTYAVAPGGPQSVMFTEGTLVITLSNASNAVVWDGTYHDREDSGPALSRKLSEDARKLLAKYPALKKK